MNGMSVTGEGNNGGISSLFKKAIKDYTDEMLTGLTDEEKAKIEAKLSAYRKECLEAGMDPKAIQSAVDSYYKKLLQEYGAKFDNSFDAAPAGASEEGNTEQGADGTGLATQPNTAKPAAANTANKSEVKTETYTDPDGTVYLVITSPSGINMKIKIGGDGESSMDMIAGVEMSKSGNPVSEYEKGIDAFFDRYEHSIDTI